MEYIFLQSDLTGALSGMWPLLLIFVVFYFFFIRPQNKRQKEQNRFVKDLERGDEVVTSSGIIGKVNKIEDDIVTIQIDQKTFIRMTKSSVSKEATDGLKKNE